VDRSGAKATKRERLTDKAQQSCQSVVEIVISSPIDQARSGFSEGRRSPAPPALAPAVPVQPKINLTLEQRHVIKELIKDLNIPSAPKNTDIALGATVPASVNLTPMPQLVAEKIPQIKTHLFFVEDGKVVIVDPKENKIVDAID
jgi:hypothetical protein